MWVSWGVIFWRFGCPNDVQTPSWLLKTLLDTTIVMIYENLNAEYIIIKSSTNLQVSALSDGKCDKCLAQQLAHIINLWQRWTIGSKGQGNRKHESRLWQLDINVSWR